jgi:uncharacterized protein YxjI
MLRQKMFSIGDKFTIKNEAGEDVFFVNGKIFSLGHKLSFQDAQGQELAFIQQKMLAFMPKYEITREGMDPVELKKNFTFFQDAFAVSVPGAGEWTIQGNFTDYEYTFSRDEQTIAQASKQWFAMTDTYGVDIADGEDDVLILACVVAVDLIHKDRERA